ncbi:MAG: hypothetical protein ACEY3H_06035, partial [Wolbachia sp.]
RPGQRWKKEAEEDTGSLNITRWGTTERHEEMEEDSSTSLLGHQSLVFTVKLLGSLKVAIHVTILTNKYRLTRPVSSESVKTSGILDRGLRS